MIRHRPSLYLDPRRKSPFGRLHSPILCLAASILWGVFHPPVSGHGIHLTGRTLGSTYLIEASYEGVEPVARGSVEVYAPDLVNLFQSGSTDPHGRFVFVPDRPGRWRVAVSDNQGHGREEEFEVPDIVLAGRDVATLDKAGSAQRSLARAMLSHVGRLSAGLVLIIVATWLALRWMGGRAVAESDR